MQETKATKVTAAKSRPRRPKAPAAKNTRRAATRSSAPADPPAVVSAVTGEKRPAEADLLAGIDIPLYRRNKRPRNSDEPPDHLLAGKEVAVQAASYALELLSCTYGTRVFCHSVILNDDLLSLWYYDATGIVYTAERLSLIHDFKKVAAIIVGFAQCTPEQLGAIPDSVMKPHISYRRKFPPENLSENTLYIPHPVTKEEVCVTLDEPVFTQYGLVGRRTFLYTMDTDQAGSEKMIMKFSYQESSRPKEHSLISIARKVRVRHLPKVHMWADLWDLSDGVRSLFHEGAGRKRGFENRTLRAIAYTRYSPIRPLFAESCELIPVMVYQMMNCEFARLLARQMI